MWLSKKSRGKTDLALQTILQSFGVFGPHTLITDVRLADPGLVIWYEAHFRYFNLA